MSKVLLSIQPHRLLHLQSINCSILVQLINSKPLVHDILNFDPLSSPLISFLKLKARLKLSLRGGIWMLKSMDDNCTSSQTFSCDHYMREM